MCGEGCHEIDRLIFPPRPISDLVGPQTVARYSVSTWCLTCGDTLSEEEQAAKFDECVFCGGVE
jgi:hypothetical protein